MTSTLRRKLAELLGDSFPEFLALFQNALEDGSYQIHGSPLRPVIVNPAVALVPAREERRQLWMLRSQGGTLGIAAIPQISKGSFVGQELLLMGTSDVDIVRLEDGSGLKLNGNIELSDGQTVQLTWNGQVWSEIARR